MNEIILTTQNDEIWASSREVAEKFEKQNKHVNETIRKLMVENSTVKNMFRENEYVSSRGRKETEFLMNRDGFSLLVMGFTGEKALTWKLKYIEAFNEMERKLFMSRFKLPTTYKEALIQLVEQVEENERLQTENNILQEKNEEMTPKAEFHDAIQVSKECVNFGKFATVLQNNSNIKIGRNKIMEWCRKQGYLCSSESLRNKPTQMMLNSGYMTYHEGVQRRNGQTQIEYTPLLTGKGQIWLTKKLLEFNQNQN